MSPLLMLGGIPQIPHRTVSVCLEKFFHAKKLYDCDKSIYAKSHSQFLPVPRQFKLKDNQCHILLLYFTK